MYNEYQPAKLTATLAHSIASVGRRPEHCGCVSGDSRRSFFHRVDRSAVQYQDPYPGLEHEMAEVNGIRCSKLHNTADHGEADIDGAVRFAMASWVGMAAC